VTPLAADAIDVHGLLQVAWVSVVASLVLTVAVSGAIVGAARAASERREGRTSAATLYLALMVVGIAVCAAGVVLAISVMLSKS
jgi:hypothetical protein